ncbi:alpha/beta fold hydrolase [Jannaschia sp. M317]|uniref:alpha/beta fold hydrolase n=1 Tax=Jannaschia sp. M317 TaxID=2867011 RepID=UPI0021A3552A|nr:alpha/beta hydrolase [Jannaschia sp. M317]UWQ18650.1 alpha/beta hydrolase [Jannaschia sp. M317]
MWDLSESYETSAGRVAAGRAGAGPPLVLAHGWPCSSYAWQRVNPALAAHYHVHFYDMPGFGRSDLAPGRAPDQAAPRLSEAGRATFFAQFTLADERFTAEVEPLSDDLQCPAAAGRPRDNRRRPADSPARGRVDVRLH